MGLRGRVSSDGLFDVLKRMTSALCCLKVRVLPPETAKGVGFAAIGRRRLLQSF